MEICGANFDKNLKRKFLHSQKYRLNRMKFYTKIGNFKNISTLVYLIE